MNYRALLEWFEREGVAYPWGEDSSPYRVWISEVMLQQTVVTAVVPFFKRWMDRFPTLEELALCEEGEVLRHWEGLGYYSRARNILKTAKILQEERGGQFPCDYKELVSLPGIGDYTASALLSISFGINRPVIDANVKRICQRLGAHSEWDKERESLWRERLDGIIADSENPGLFNGALMQLGQLVCRTGTPDCASCPLSGDCLAYKQNIAHTIPVKKKREKVELTSRVRIYTREGNKGLSYWIIQRNEGIGRGLWTFPREDAEITIAEGWESVASLKERVHNYTKYKETLKPEIQKWIGKGKEILPPGAYREGEGFWASAGELAVLATPAVYRKIINELIT
ncbi:MAG: A/G-specific adenine glycosylase [Spirochaetales bacterium]|nr:A/G-specific adenine glycosylase [Spirochaetales bacterium]